MSGNRAREGICLLLNNDVVGAEEIFEDDPDSIETAAGKCFVTFINALLSFESERIDEAVEGLRELEQRCSQDVGWLRSMKNSVFGSSFSLADPDVAVRLEEQIILADTQVCLALLTFLQQDLTSYVKGGWRLRKAWKVYQNIYTTILDLYKEAFPADANLQGSEFPLWRDVTPCASGGFAPPTSSVPHSASQSFLSPNQSAGLPRSKSQSGMDTASQPGLLRSSISYLSSFVVGSSIPENRIPPEVVARLMSAVSFGFGIFQLCVSLVPPSLLKIVHLLGFNGNRSMALKALMFARKGTDMRAPLAMFALLWYHTIVRPFFSLDGANIKAGVQVASQLYEESKAEFAESALFLFFLGRIERLKSNIPAALRAYELAIEKSPQREVQLICLHEVGWCYLTQLDWANAYHCFLKLREKSRWAKILYTYLAGVCAGAGGDSERMTKLLQKIPKYLPETAEGRTFLETYIARRVYRIKEPPVQDACILFGMEMLYLWNCLPSCNANAILQECAKCKEEPMTGVTKFIQGVAYTYIGDLDKAEQNLREVLDSRKDILADPANPDENDDHISVFASIELATLLFLKPDTFEEGQTVLRDVKKFKGYDFDHKANLSIQAVLHSSNK